MENASQSKLVAGLLVLLLSGTANGTSLQVAVATNFRATLEHLVAESYLDAGRTLKISSGSSGMLYAQILHGAPFDVFLSADSKFPRRLEQQGLVLDGSRQVYARGLLVLVYQPDLAAVAQAGIAALLTHPGLSLATANPRLSPYGAAAQQVLERVGSTPSPRLQGVNIGQAYQFWHGGGADAGLIARSQAQPPWLDIPRHWYGGLQQQAVVLRHSANRDRARHFLQWLLSPASQAAIVRAGYGQGGNSAE